MNRAEAARKALHIGLSSGAAAVVHVLDPTPAAAVLAFVTLVALLVELARRVSGATARVFSLIDGLLKDGEQGRLTGATLLSLGFTTTAVLFPGPPALAGILIAGVADPAAAVAGRRWKGRRYPGGKSAAGSAAFVVASFGLVLALGSGLAVAFAVSGLLAVVEAFTLPVDDNLYLPPAGAACMVVVGWLTSM